MTKRETVKFIVQMIASIATAIVTALGATSCIGYIEKLRKKSPSGGFFSRKNLQLSELLHIFATESGKYLL